RARPRRGQRGIQGAPRREAAGRSARRADGAPEGAARPGMTRILAALLLACPLLVQAGRQERESLTEPVRSRPRALAREKAPPRLLFRSPQDGQKWLSDMSQRLEKRIPDRKTRLEFLRTVHFESKNNGLDPQLILALIEVESGFRKYAVSVASARGYM